MDKPCEIIRDILPQDLADHLAAHPATLIVDVRELDEWDAQHMDGAQHFPLSALLAGQRPALSPETEIILYCAHGVRSRHAAQILQADGYKNLINLAGGYVAWEESLP